MLTEVIKSKISQVLTKMNLDSSKINVQPANANTNADFATNVALLLAKSVGVKPQELASQIAQALQADAFFESVSVAGPGFINMNLASHVFENILNEILKQNHQYPILDIDHTKYNIEFVSANPTGYLHIGHARNAAFGETWTNMAKKLGCHVVKEYYINDAGNQMDKLASSILVRYKQILGQDVELPDDSYHGEEIIDVAKALYDQYGDQFKDASYDTNFNIEQKDVALILRKFGRDYLLAIIKKDLQDLGVTFDIWFSETTIHENKLIDKTLAKLGDYIYQKDGATWLATTKFGDDKDRVLIKSTGTPTYFMPDIAYHDIKLTRDGGVDKVVNIWGADHRSYVDRMSVALQCLGFEKQAFNVVCMQMVKLVKNGAEFKLSKRSGNSLTTADLVNAIGKDAARWYLISQSVDSHLTIDVDIALSKDNKNPIYYVEYAHARINTILQKAKGIVKDHHLDLLTNKQEKALINTLATYDSMIQICVNNYEPHKMANYLWDLAKQFHAYYANNKIIDETNPALSSQRLYLISAIKVILANGLDLLGIDAYESM